MDYGPASTQEVVVVDNEPQVIVSPVNEVVNAGEFASIPVSMSVDSTGQELHFFIDEEKTTARADDFSLNPESGVVQFPLGARDSSLEIQVASDLPGQTLGQDAKIFVKSEVDQYKEFDISEITINEWPLGNDQTEEIVELLPDEVSAIGLTSDAQGRVYVLKQGVNGINESYVTFAAYYRDASPYPLTVDMDQLSIQSTGTNVVAKTIVYSDVGEGIISVVSEVDGLVGSVHRGGIDLLVSNYKMGVDGKLSLSGHFQFGTEQDDRVEGATTNGSSLYVYGSTSGQQFDGVPPDQASRGGDEGFVYRFEIGGSSVQKLWSSFVGNSNDNSVLGLGSASSESFALVLDGLESNSAYIQVLNSNW